MSESTRWLKPEMIALDASSVLFTIHGDGVKDVEPIEMGELSRVFRYTFDAKRYVVQFRASDESFRKADVVHRLFGTVLPVPRVVARGDSSGLKYCITELIEGVPASSVVKSGDEPVVAEIVEFLIRKNAIAIAPERGFGGISSDGTAPDASWSNALRSVFREPTAGAYENWTELFATGALDRPLFSDGLAAMSELLNRAPAQPYLVHGDFHLGNMIVDGERVNGIVDWEFAMYGDFVFDVATMEFWNPALGFAARVLESLRRVGEDPPHFTDRLTCYEMYGALVDMRFFAHRGERRKYESVRRKLIELLGSA